MAIDPLINRNLVSDLYRQNYSRREIADITGLSINSIGMYIAA